MAAIGGLQTGSTNIFGSEQDCNEIPIATIKFQKQDVIGIITDTAQCRPTRISKIQDGSQ